MVVYKVWKTVCLDHESFVMSFLRLSAAFGIEGGLIFQPEVDMIDKKFSYMSARL